MALIKTIEPEAAQGVVADVYNEIKELFGFVPNAIRLDSINPEHMARHWGGIRQVLEHPSLSQQLFTTMRLLISEAQRCDYCVGLNAGMLMQMHGLSQEQVAAISSDPVTAPLDAKEKALLLFTLRAIEDSNAVSAEEIEALKQAGASEREIHDALAHGSQQVAGDIMLNAFKVEPDLH
jgi:alkylhydroperoxidase family enzyme